MRPILLTPERVAAIEWRQTFTVIARQEGVSLSCAWNAWKRSGRTRQHLKPRTRHALTLRVEAKRKEAA